MKFEFGVKYFVSFPEWLERASFGGCEGFGTRRRFGRKTALPEKPAKM